VKLEVSLPSLPHLRIDRDRLLVSLSTARTQDKSREHAEHSAEHDGERLHRARGLNSWPVPKRTGWRSPSGIRARPHTPEGQADPFDRRWQPMRGHELGSAFRITVARVLVQAHGGHARVGSLSGRTAVPAADPSAG